MQEYKSFLASRANTDIDVNNSDGMNNPLLSLIFDRLFGIIEKFIDNHYSFFVKFKDVEVKICSPDNY